ncbi:MAG: Hsp20/alpha crystallin family protein [Candidatus Kariarchaeaceae archaeon]|jgi:HSP20 family molecular chaperone IbpA
MANDRETLVVKNGKIISSTYLDDFHSFREDNILILFILLPGIIKQSILVHIDGYNLEIQANIHEKYKRIYRTSKISIKGKLTAEVEPNSFLVQYEHGIIELCLALAN